MDDDTRKNLGMVRGGLYGRRDPRSWAVRQCGLEMRERLVAIMAGKKKSRKLRCIQSNITHPLGEPLDVMCELKDARLGYEASWEIVIAPQARALARLHGREFDTGEFSPPHAA